MLIAAVTVTGEHKYVQNITVGPHALVADEPPALGGTDAGPPPFGLVLSGLGACTAITLRMYAERRGWNLGTIDVRLKLFQEKKGQEGGLIEREVSFGGALSKEQCENLAAICEKTPVTRALKAGMTIHTTLA